MEINNVAIFGGNGTVGSLMSAIISSFGKANVYLISRDKKKINDELFSKIFNSIKSDSIKNRIIPCNYDDVKEILNNCEWIFESVSEDYKIKKQTYELINEFANPNAIITTGTSGLSINELANAFTQERKKYFFGTHFFNPPYHMNLCEIVVSEHTNIDIIHNFREYLEKVLLRKTIIVKDCPAFIANRIGFKIMNDLLLLAEKEENGIEYIDSLFTGITGRNIPPLATIDFVGLDIHKAIIENIYQHTDDEFRNSFIIPEWFSKQIEKGRLGNKTDEGLFKKKEKNVLVYNIKKEQYVNINNKKIEELEEIKKIIKDGEYIKAYKKLFDRSIKEKYIIEKTLIEYIVYSIYISDLVSNKTEDCDDAMANGFGWCPPIALKELIDEVADFKKLCTEHIGKTIMNKYNLYEKVDNLSKSKYDYRKYIKAV